MENGVAERLRTAMRAAGPVDETELAALSAGIIVVAQGLIQRSRLNVDTERLDRIAEASHAMLPAWADRTAA
jgi:hypothetical protein